MMRLICDRCQKPVDNQDQPKHAKVGSRVYDLCQACNESFEQWLRATDDKHKTEKMSRFKAGLEKVGEVVRDAANNVDTNTKNTKW